MHKKEFKLQPCMKTVYANFFRHSNKIALILELASSNIMLFLLTPPNKNTLLLSRQITIPATAEHVHFMAYVKRQLKQHTHASATLAKQTSRLHCATTMTSHTRTHVNTTTTSVRRKKNPV